MPVTNNTSDQPGSGLDRLGTRNEDAAKFQQEQARQDAKTKEIASHVINSDMSNGRR